MKITTDNYIEIFISHFEGRLTAEESVQLMQFIAEHPQLQQEFDQLQTVFLQPAETEKINFTHLLKDVNQLTGVNACNFEELCIAELEGDLHNPTLRGQLYQWINANEDNRKTFSLYRQTQIHPDEKTVFPHKKVLKKREKQIDLTGWAYRSLAIAASVALLLGLVQWWIANRESFRVQPMATDIPVKSQPMAVNTPAQPEHKRQPDRQNEIAYNSSSSRKARLSVVVADSAKSGIRGKEQLQPISELSPRMAVARTYIPYSEFIIIDEKIFYRNLPESPDHKPYLTMGEWMNEQVKKMKEAIFKLPEENPLTRIAGPNLQQMNLLAGNHVIFRQNTDTLYGRKQVEVNLGWVAFYFSYSKGKE